MDRDRNLTGDHHRERHASAFQIKIFGLGSILYLIGELIRVCASEKDANITPILKTCLTLLCCVLFVIFITMYREVVLKKIQVCPLLYCCNAGRRSVCVGFRHRQPTVETYRQSCQ